MLMLELFQPGISQFLDVLAAFGNVTEVLGLLPDILIRNFHPGLLGLAGPCCQRTLDIRQLLLIALGRGSASILLTEVLLLVTQNFGHGAEGDKVSQGVVCLGQGGMDPDSALPSLYTKHPADIDLFCRWVLL